MAGVQTSLLRLHKMSPRSRKVDSRKQRHGRHSGGGDASSGSCSGGIVQDLNTVPPAEVWGGTTVPQNFISRVAPSVGLPSYDATGLAFAADGAPNVLLPLYLPVGADVQQAVPQTGGGGAERACKKLPAKKSGSKKSGSKKSGQKKLDKKKSGQKKLGKKKSGQKEPAKEKNEKKAESKKKKKKSAK